MQSFSTWFPAATGHQSARRWQCDLAESTDCSDRLIRVPTGLGKTEGVLAAWGWNRLVRNDPAWPRRLVWCLPMRVLVEQTFEAASGLLQRLGRLGDGQNGDVGGQAVRVQRLMGGLDSGDWHLHPECPAILIGTQDMLLSRALNRGYGSGRARWPIEFGLLNQDCLWVMDEVQLMDVGLTTSVQLQAFRHQELPRSVRPCHTWWMSATLQPDWLNTVDFEPHLGNLRGETLYIPSEQRQGPLWEVRKPLTQREVPAKGDKNAEQLAAAVLAAHQQALPGELGRVTLAIVNRVATAQQLHEALQKGLKGQASPPDLELIHSRFRGLEREQWPERFLSRGHCENPQTDLILIATQVVEAGVDISATALITELAPWSSLVQRFGRSARYGGGANVLVVDRQLSGKDCAPYEQDALAAAAEGLAGLDDVSVASLEQYETVLRDTNPELLARLYPYDPLHVLTRRECDELFDTSPDLTGADLDISRYIRSGDQRDLLVCWVEVDWAETQQRSAPPPPPPDLQPLRQGLCPVPVSDARKWLLDKNRLKEGCRAWTWDYLEGAWKRLQADACYPGQVLLVDAAWGGYDIRRGFTGKPLQKKGPVFEVAAGLRRGPQEQQADLAQDLAQDNENLSLTQGWKTIATHGGEAARRAGMLAQLFGLPADVVRVLDLAARAHDWGKAHPVFQSNLRVLPEGLQRHDLAKAPPGAWVSWKEVHCRAPSAGQRKGFRHELASTLALFELLARIAPQHDALVGPYRELLEQGFGESADPAPPVSDCPLAEELAELDARQFNLLLYLVCCHHGKVRGVWQSTPQDQDFPLEQFEPGRGQPLRGVREGDVLPQVELRDRQGQPTQVPELTLHLDPAAIGLSSRYGPGWTERVQDLMQTHGPFTLALLETLLRTADVWASRLDNDPDPLLQTEVAR